MFRACFRPPKVKAPALQLLEGTGSFDSGSDDPLLEDNPLQKTKDLDANKNIHTNVDDNNVHNVLLEIVGAIGLSFVKENNIDSFCIVKVGEKEVHRTKTIDDDTSPIWTIKSKSLCLLDLTSSSSTSITVQLCYTNNSIVPAVVGNVSQALSATKTVVGSVALARNQLLEGTGDRQEFALPEQPAVSLALRFRKATRSDCLYFHNIASRKVVPNRSSSPNNNNHHKDHAADTDFKGVSGKNVLKVQEKTVIIDNKKRRVHRVWPFPDPQNVEGTTFLTKEQLYASAKQPSKQWVEAGYGDYGTVHLEILGCDHLPNMDTEFVSGKTDAFVAIAFEGSYVRSSVIHDSLNPRWVPWSHRAFMLQVEHPSSILYLGVFDYDGSLLDQHDPIGRVVIHLDNFNNDTVYTLKYPLHHEDTQEENHRGSVTIRLRIRWKNLSEVSKAQSFVPPPRFMINVETEKSWKILRYLTRGSIDMTQVTVQSVKLYVNELISYWGKYCYLLDVLVGVLLWRGRLHITKNLSIWFPIHSAVLFAAVAFAIECPQFLPSIFLYAIAYALLMNNYYLSSHPSPWSRVRSFGSIIATSRFGSSSSRLPIEPETGVEEADTLRLLDEYKMHRVTGFLYEILNTSLKVYKVYSKNTPVDISTVAKSGSLFSQLYVDYLAYAHMMLRLLCKQIRVLRNFVNWKVHTTYKFTINLLLLATAWTFFPYKHWAHWAIRIVVWLCLGPWVKLIDACILHKYYRTKEDILRDGIPSTTEEMKVDIANRPNILHNILKSSWVQTMGKSGRIVVEDNLKLRDFREETYGRFSERVPAVDTSRFPSIPLSSSFAQPFLVATTGEEPPAPAAGDDYYQDLPPEAQTWSYVPGQKLDGKMIPQPRIRATKGVAFSN